MWYTIYMYNQILKNLKLVKPLYLIIGAIVVVLLLIIIISNISGGKKTPKVISRPIGQLSTNFSVGSTGDVRISGIAINAINNGVIFATSTINEKAIAFVINSNSDTLIKKNNATSTVKKLAVGDVLMISGTLQGFGETITVLAKEIRTIGYYQPGTPAINGTVPPRTTVPPKVISPVKSPTKATTTQKTLPAKTTTIKK